MLPFLPTCYQCYQLVFIPCRDLVLAIVFAHELYITLPFPNSKQRETFPTVAPSCLVQWMITFLLCPLLFGVILNNSWSLCQFVSVTEACTYHMQLCGSLPAFINECKPSKWSIGMFPVTLAEGRAFILKLVYTNFTLKLGSLFHCSVADINLK